MGIPILNDRIYPTLMPELPDGTLPDLSRPLQLLARSLEFEDPITGAPRLFTSQQHLRWPEGFEPLPP
jgi:tRNA pseudouridine32 synthase/23S rRNA pseudouridine746 synthase